MDDRLGQDGRARDDELAFASGLLAKEADAVAALGQNLGQPFCDAVAMIEACAARTGTVLVCGLGKSGLIAQKISATLASLGIPSHWVHPTEAAHGDLGRFRARDVCICLSFSGETREVVDLASILRHDDLAVIAITRTPSDGHASSLERVSRLTLHLPIEQEAGEPEFLAPTSSTTATLALGDALALCAARRRHFTSTDFAKRHPGGSLGGLLRRVTDAMRTRVGHNLTLIPLGLTVREALRRAQGEGTRRSGALLIVSEGDQRLEGILTDGDLRRLVLEDDHALDLQIGDVMTRSPRVVRDDATLGDAVALFREHRQDEIPVVDERGCPVGLLDVQDLVTLRLVSD